MSHLQSEEQRELAESIYVKLMGWDVYMKWIKIKVAAGMADSSEKDFILWLLSFVESHINFEQLDSDVSVSMEDLVEAGEGASNGDTATEDDADFGGDVPSSEPTTTVKTEPESCRTPEPDQVIDHEDDDAIAVAGTSSGVGVFPNTEFPMLSLGPMLDNADVTCEPNALETDFDNFYSSGPGGINVGPSSRSDYLLDAKIRLGLEDQGALDPSGLAGSPFFQYSPRAPGQGRKPKNIGPILPREAINLLQANVKRGRPPGRPRGKFSTSLGASFLIRPKHTKVPADVLQKHTERVLAMKNSSAMFGVRGTTLQTRRRGRPRKS